MHLILTGATGLVGSAALHAMLADPAVARVTVLSRRPVPQAAAHPKARVVIHSDFTTYPASLAPELRGARGAVWALGISQTAVDKAEYTRITRELPAAFARWTADNLTSDEPFNLVHVSGAGATQQPSALTPLFGRVKGEAERELETIGREGGFSVYNVRVGGVDARAQPEIHEFVPRVGWAAGAAKALALPLLGVLMPGKMSPTRELGRGLVALAKGDGGALTGEGVSGFEGRIVENARLMKMGKGEQ